MTTYWKHDGKNHAQKQAKEKFGEIECTSLKIVDVDGKTRVRLTTTGEHGGFVAAYDNDGKALVFLSGDEDGGLVVVKNKGGESFVNLRASDDSGSVHGEVQRRGIVRESQCL